MKYNTGAIFTSLRMLEIYERNLGSTDMLHKTS